MNAEAPTVAANPHVSLFQVTSPLFTSFEPDFLNTMPSLLPIPDGVNQMSLGTSVKFDAGESLSQAGGFPFVPANDYFPDKTFTNDINTTLGSSFPNIVESFGQRDVSERATAQSCGGCHQVSNNDFLGQADISGPGVVWPPSLGFVHVDENSILSTALLGTFLPHRQQVLDNFLAATCGTECLDGGKLIKVAVEGVDENGKELVMPEVDFDIIPVDEFDKLELPEFDTLGGSRTH